MGKLNDKLEMQVALLTWATCCNEIMENNMATIGIIKVI